MRSKIVTFESFMADNITPESSNWNERVEYLSGLAQIVRDQGLTLLELEGQGWKVTLKGAVPQVVAAPEVLAAAPTFAPLSTLPLAGPATSAAPVEENLTPVVSPMVGVFYRSPSPADPPFVEVGDRVEAGQTIGLVEAMKVFNEITAESGGIVAKINVESGQLVETGAPLIMLRR
jgi:acetyl-CoA carboxylase biotin carboxyl carrier protein